MNTYASHLLSGRSLLINFSTWNHTNQSTGNDQNFSNHINRALARFKSVFITLKHDDTQTDKQCSDFYHPAGLSNGGSTLVLEDEHSYQIQIASKLVPEYPIK